MTSVVLAQTAAEAAVNWNVVTALGVLASLAANLIMASRVVSGKAGERQIEPTQIHALSAQISDLVHGLSAINREIGEVHALLTSVQRETGVCQAKHGNELMGVHQRIGGISRELAATTSRVDGLEKRENLHA